jgi:energy-coupling factor transport system ATP-binding protein
MSEAVQADLVFVMNQGKIMTKGEPCDVFSERKYLDEIGLDIPVISKLMWRIKEMGGDVNPAVFSIDKAIEELLPLFSKRR